MTRIIAESINGKFQVSIKNDDGTDGWECEPTPIIWDGIRSIICNCPLLDEMYGWNVPYELNLFGTYIGTSPY